METTFAYLAGAIDADGCISIYRKVWKRKNGEAVVYYEPRVSLGEILPTIPDLLHTTFGGYRGTHLPKNLKSRPYHQWLSCGKATGDVLMALMPYLRLKAEQARVAMRMCELMMDARKSKQRTIPDNEYVERGKLWEKMKELNQSGRGKAWTDERGINLQAA